MREVAEDIWIQEDSLKLGAVTLGLRMTIVRLTDGGLWIHSPTRLNDAIHARVAGLGPVSCLVAPNNGHNLFLMDWAEEYPGAEVFCARGIPKKLPELTEYTLLENEVGSPWPEDLHMQVMEGFPFLDECIFLHRSSGSLIVTDLVQNHRNTEQQGLGRLQQKLMLEPLGFKDICLAPPLRFRFMIKDPEAFRASVSEVLSWPFERIILTHGEILLDDARPTLHRLCERFQNQE